MRKSRLTLDVRFYLNMFSCVVTHAVYFPANMNRLLTVAKARSILFPFPGDVVDLSRCRLQPTCFPHQTLTHRMLHQSVLCRLLLLLSVHFCRHSSIDSSALLAFLSTNNTSFTSDCFAFRVCISWACLSCELPLHPVVHLIQSQCSNWPMAAIFFLRWEFALGCKATSPRAK